VQPPARARVAPLADAVCIIAFVVVGRGHHDIDEGVGWFLTVLWPLYAGWFGVALLARLYTRATGGWAALAVTIGGGVLVASLLRGTFTDRPYFGIFTVIAIAFLAVTTFAWRAVAGAGWRPRRSPAPETRS
jgi:hypothetical protein